MVNTCIRWFNAAASVDLNLSTMKFISTLIAAIIKFELNEMVNIRRFIQGSNFIINLLRVVNV